MFRRIVVGAISSCCCWLHASRGLFFTPHCFFTSAAGFVIAIAFAIFDPALLLLVVALGASVALLLVPFTHGGGSRARAAFVAAVVGMLCSFTALVVSPFVNVVHFALCRSR